MKLQLLLATCIVFTLVGCRRESTNEPTEKAGGSVNGSYGDAGIAAGAKASPTNNDTNLLRSPSNTLHRVAQ